MTWGAVAVGVGTLGAGIASSRAATSAAEAGAEGAERSAAQVQAAADRARGDVLDFFPTAQQDLLAGAGAAGDIITQGIGEQQRLFSGGNIGAQGTLGAGFGQVQNALLGLPVDQQAFAPRPIELSQPLVNPLSQTPQQPGQPQPPGLFTDIADVQPAARRQELQGVNTNADVLSRIASGQVSIPGVDPGFINAVVSGQPNTSFLDSKSFLDVARANKPASTKRFLDNTGFNAENREQFNRILTFLAQTGVE